MSPSKPVGCEDVESLVEDRYIPKCSGSGGGKALCFCENHWIPQ
jgi:hypothetical protein